MIRKGQADGLLIAKLDRLSRSVVDWNTLIDSYFGERAGKQFSPWPIRSTPERPPAGWF